MKLRSIVIAVAVAGSILPGVSVANETSNRTGDRSWGFQTTFENQARFNQANALQRYRWDRKHLRQGPQYQGGLGGGGNTVIEHIDTYQGIEGSISNIANQTVTSNETNVTGDTNTISGEILNDQVAEGNTQTGETEYSGNTLGAETTNSGDSVNDINNFPATN